MSHIVTALKCSAVYCDTSLFNIVKTVVSSSKDIAVYWQELVEFWRKELPNAEIFPISAAEKFGIEQLFERIKALLPDSPPFFDKDALTDRPERFFVNEIIREKILLNYDKEIPYAVEVLV